MKVGGLGVQLVLGLSRGIILSRGVWSDAQLICSSPTKGVEGDIFLNIWSEVKNSVPSVDSCTDKPPVTYS